MSKCGMNLLELLPERCRDRDVDFFREGLHVLVEGIMDAGVSAQIGARHGERNPERLTHRNGYSSRDWDTRVGTIELRIPKVREGSYFPSLLEPRWRSEKALLAVIQQAYVERVSTRRVDDLIKALGCDSFLKSQVSRICEAHARFPVGPLRHLQRLSPTGRGKPYWRPTIGATPRSRTPSETSRAGQRRLAGGAGIAHNGTLDGAHRSGRASSRPCDPWPRLKELDQVVETFLGRPLDGGPYPYVWLDALTQKVRHGGRIVNVSVVVATGVNGTGQREVLGMGVGVSEDGAFWLAFLRSLNARAYGGVELVISDAHHGLKQAIATVFAGASWRRCRTHFMTNLLTGVPKRSHAGVATMVRAIYPGSHRRRFTPRRTGWIAQLREHFPQAAQVLEDALPDTLAFTAFPVSHCPEPAEGSGPRIHWNG